MNKYIDSKMRKLVIASFFTLLTSLFNTSDAQKFESSFFQLADTFLKKHVDARGYVAYEKIKQEPEDLNNLYSTIASYELKNKSLNEIKAFYTNTYNILVIKQVIDLYPIQGPLKVNGFFDGIQHNVSGEMLTLNQVEKDKNLYITKDERLHFALVCAAKSCPPLAQFAFTPEKIDEQLNERTKYALNDENFIRTSNKGVELSQIFSWYADDFKDKSSEGIVGYINKYREKQIQTGDKIVYYEYDWNLNKQ